ncbi:glycosyltransferase [Brevibacterium sp. 5221]|uniref:D-inositol 3-phosphate glycosyltransferase n=2 Tax=Brevibacterium rongguiense TaxID=2695267 RepID=A0A6N9H6W5_9MICO|nr:glycosyltransferase [Brevibacterium rongguiense]
MNGVVHSILRVLEHLDERGDEVLVIAPQAPLRPEHVAGARVAGVPSFALPGYRRVRVAAGGVPRIRRLLADFAPDVVHLASPFVLGWRAALACEELGLPAVAVYQTEVPAYAARYGLPGLEKALWTHVRALHARAALTLAPSSHALDQLADHGIERLALWARGVDAHRFDPAHRSQRWRRTVAPGGERIIGCVGRLAAEKQVGDLAALLDIAGTRLVIVGEGPQRRRLEAALPGAVFTGFLGGDALAQAVAGFDLMVAPGELETFCQTIQEAMASGVPVIAPARGGPLDLVDSSRTGWLYAPGDLAGMRAHALDLLGDEAKRRAFGQAARRAVEARSWKGVCSQLVGHYAAAIEATAAGGPVEQLNPRGALSPRGPARRVPGRYRRRT